MSRPRNRRDKLRILKALAHGAVTDTTMQQVQQMTPGMIRIVPGGRTYLADQDGLFDSKLQAGKQIDSKGLRRELKMMQKRFGGIFMVIINTPTDFPPNPNVQENTNMPISTIVIE